ncbi:UDP-N-acetylglucosamine--N-acetylmuramyl-(pentapeptide) pyrophosphoryl-undecaprenol N-acetylglucosamine transferase [Candidatus Curtissbacteria bacterium]|nr:UDP-N-acetylglucosamine--N-acetylmuramyl-(pentapeptide) pyrophosphoryl-undecaprenol N-acetylglucosamine transferase [Candidatus Curtissbacteria bacterium]
MKKIAICGGHLTPAIALVEALEKKGNANLFFFTRKSATEGNSQPSAEYKEAQKHKVTIITLVGGRIQRRFTSQTIPALLKIPLTFVQSFLYLLAYWPDITVVVGGSLSFPVVFNSWLLGIPIVVHEQAVEPGLSNRLNALFAQQIFITWPESQKFFPNEKTQLIGNLTRKSANVKSTNKSLQKALDTKLEVLLVTGGNQGSHFLNKMVFENLNLFKKYKLIHILGNANYGGDHEASAKIKSPNYSAFEYLDAADMTAVYKKAKIVVSRSGANTVWDLAQIGKVSILIPLPIAAAGEQYKNAQILENAGSAVIVDEQNYNEKVLESALNDMSANYKNYDLAAQKYKNDLALGGVEKLTSYLNSF